MMGQFSVSQTSAKRRGCHGLRMGLLEGAAEWNRTKKNSHDANFVAVGEGTAGRGTKNPRRRPGQMHRRGNPFESKPLYAAADAA